ncbi:MAG: HAMP domain-containing histidine kinase, partial [Chitinophagaceae bacterium]
MFQQIVNWRTVLAAIAIGIVTGTIFYSQYLAGKIAGEERQKVEHWVEASKSLLNPAVTDIRLPFRIVSDNHDIPIIETDENDSITNYVNLDSARSVNDPAYLKRKLADLKSINLPILYTDPLDSTKINRYYFGHTALLNEVSIYPIVQLIIVGLFIIVVFLALRSSYRSVQNQVWAGMAKETAHQLGTPVSSLEGWVEMMKEMPGNEAIVQDLGKDVDRLRLVSDRFGKIGSTPQLEKTDLVKQINDMVDYIRKRSPGRVLFSVETHGRHSIEALISPPLFDWVIENLLKNALDAMEGRGSIHIDMIEEAKSVTIDVTDTGKGISFKNVSKVFKPGFTTKKRGWGLGLSLSKRIIS